MPREKNIPRSQHPLCPVKFSHGTANLRINASCVNELFAGVFSSLFVFLHLFMPKSIFSWVSWSLNCSPLTLFSAVCVCVCVTGKKDPQMSRRLAVFTQWVRLPVESIRNWSRLLLRRYPETCNIWPSQRGKHLSGAFSTLQEEELEFDVLLLLLHCDGYSIAITV